MTGSEGREASVREFKASELRRLQVVPSAGV